MPATTPNAIPPQRQRMTNAEASRCEWCDRPFTMTNLAIQPGNRVRWQCKNPWTCWLAQENLDEYLSR